MSYKNALTAAGAEVLNFEYFGDYSGQWFAKVRYNGETGWIQDWYGSCTHCDAFEAEFGNDYEEGADYEKRLANFGKPYLNTILPAQHYLPELDAESDWDSNSAHAAAWIRHVEGMK